MRILMGIPAPWLKGGPATHLPLLVEYFQKKNDTDIKTFYFGSQRKNEKENIILKLLNTSKALIKFIYLVIKYKPHIIQLNSAFDKTSIFRDVPFAIAARLAFKPLLFKVHGSHNDLLYTKNPLLRILITLYFWGATKVGVLSEIEKNEFIQQFGNKSKLIVVKNIVRFPKTEITLNNIDQECFLKPYDALFVSRIEKGKGLEDLLHALPLIIKTCPTFLIAIAGTGSSLSEYKDLANDLNISRHLNWLGHIENEKLEIYFRESGVFVFPSHFPEGMPMSMIEALLYGMPIITTKTRFALSYLKPEENVLFIDKEMPEQIAGKIIYLKKNPSLCAKMKKNNYAFIQQFAQEKVGEEFSKVYNEMGKKNSKTFKSNIQKGY